MRQEKPPAERVPVDGSTHDRRWKWPKRRQGTMRVLCVILALMVLVIGAPAPVHAWDLLPDDPALGNPPVAPSNCPLDDKTIAFTAQNGEQTADVVGIDPLYGLPIFKAYAQDGNVATAAVTNLSNVDLVTFSDASWGIAQTMLTLNGGDHPAGAFMEVTIAFDSPLLNPAFMIVEADSGGATNGFLDQYTAIGYLNGVAVPYDALYGGSGIDLSRSDGTTADWSGMESNYGAADPENRGLVYYGGVNDGSAWVDTIVVKYIAGRATSNQIAGIQMPEGCVSVGTAKEVASVVNNGNDTFTISYDIRAINDGALPIYNLQLSDDLGAVFGPANVLSSAVVSSSSVSLNPNYDGVTDTNLLTGRNTQAPNGTATLTLAVTVPASIAGSEPFNNQVTATSTVAADPNSPTLTDLSDNGANPSPNDNNGAGGVDDPTPVGLPAISVIKSVAGPPTTNLGANAAIVDAGDQINYTFIVENSGSVALDPVSLTDSMLSGISCSQSALAVGVSMTCSAEPYTLTQADLDAGGVQNSASVSGVPPPNLDGSPATPVTANSDSGTDPNGAAVSDPENTETSALDGSNDGDPANDPTVLLLAVEPSIRLVKTIDIVTDDTVTETVGTDATVVDAGDQITYGFVVENMGNVTLDPVRVMDSMLTNIVCSANSLAPNAAMTCTADPYTLTQADVDDGGVENSATAVGTPPSNPDGTPALSVSDTSDDGTNGDEETETDDLGGSTTGDPTDDQTVYFVPPMPSIQVVKSIDSISRALGADAAIVDAGDQINYAFIVSNTGNVTLDPIRVSDPMVTNITCAATSLAPGVSTMCGADPYTLTQADVDAGGVQNLALANGTPPTGIPPSGPDGTPSSPVTDESDAGTDPNGEPVNDPDGSETDSLDPNANDGDSTNDPTVALIPSMPVIQIVKSVDMVSDTNTSGLTDAGDQISYTFMVTNKGNVTLDSVRVSDPMLTNIVCSATSLAPGNDMSCTADPYTLTQADVNAGGVENRAGVTGAPPPAPDGTPSAPVSDDSDAGTEPDGGPVDNPDGSETDSLDPADNDGDSTNDPTVLLIAAMPSIEIVKSIATVSTDLGLDGNNVDAGDEITYTFTVSNRGNVTLDPVIVSDSLLTNIVCAAQSLAPASSMTCRADPYTITQNDVNSAGVENSASVTGTPPAALDGTPATPVMDESDSGTDTDGSGVDDPSGTETDALDPNENDGDSTNDPTVLSIPPDPSIRLTKESVNSTDANGSGTLDAGDTISYTFTVLNTGNVTLDPILVMDANVANITCTLASLPPNGSTSCSGDLYTITQADMDAGYVENTATVEGMPPPAPDGTPSDPVSDRSDDGTDGGDEETETPDGRGDTNGDPTDDPTVFAIPLEGSIELRKSFDSFADVNENGLTDAGDEINYSFMVINTGNVTLDNVAITDSKVTNIMCTLTTLVPAESTTCAGNVYTITQADVDAGGVENTATVNSTDPIGAPLSDTSDSDEGTDADETDGLDESTNGDPTDDPTVVPIPALPSIMLVKEIAGINDGNASGTTDLGDTVSFTFTVWNTGNVTLDPIVVTDSMLTNIVCAATSLAPAASTACTADPYAITQADINAGGIENRATAEGAPPLGADGTPSDSVVDMSDDGTGAGDENTETPSLDGTKNGDPTDDPTVLFLDQNPAIALEKSGIFMDESGDGFSQAGETIAYTFTVMNTGNVDLTNIIVDDPLIGVTGDPLAFLAVGDSDSTTFTGVYTLIQTDINAGIVENRATTEGTAPSGNLVTDMSDDPQDPINIDPNGDGDPDDPTVTSLTPMPAIRLLKVGSFVDENGDGVAQVGETILYAFTVENVGNVDISNVNVSDGLISVVGGPIVMLAVGERDRTTFSGRYMLTNEDVAMGSVTNSATAEATDPNGNPVTDDSDDPTNPANADPNGDGNPDDPTVTSFVQPDVSSFSSFYWFDSNADGIKDADEEPIVGAEVTVFNLTGGIIAQTTTDENGLFEFSNLPLGDFQLHFTPPTGFDFTQRNASGGPNSGVDETGFMNIILRPGSTEVSTGAGVVAEGQGSKSPRAIVLSNFTVELGNNTNLIARWKTSAEINTSGFHLLLSRDRTLLGALQVTSEIIPSQGSSGGSYEVVLPYNGLTDSALNQATFWLYEVENDQSIHYYGPASVELDASQRYRSTFLPLINQLE